MECKRRVALRRYIVPTALVCCLLFVGVGSAKMINTALITKSGEAHVAKWSVVVNSSDNDNITLDAGNGTQSYSLVVTNNSEVASTYSIKVSNIPDDVKVGLDIASNNDLVDPTNGEIVFSDTGNALGFESPNNTRTHTLTLAADATAEVTQTSTDMSIEVLFTQKDPRS